jgi:transposase
MASRWGRCRLRPTATGDGLLAATLDTTAVLGPLPARPVVHLDAGYDWQPCRRVLAERRMVGEIATRGPPAPIQASRRWPVERTHAWGNQYSKLRWCTERRRLVVEFWLALVSAAIVKHLPGRPKTDRLDSVWLAKVAERQMLRPRFVPPPSIRQLRDVARYRADLVAARTAETQRVERAAGGRPDQTLGGGLRQLRRLGPGPVGRAHRGDTRSQGAGAAGAGRMRAKRACWRRPSVATCTDHHGFLLAKMLARVDLLDTDIAELDRKLEELIAPFAHAVERLDEITGVGRTAARVIISEIGVDMGRFATAGHLASWAKFTPGVKESAGKTKGKESTGHGNPYLARVLGEAAVAAGKTDTFLGERYRRIARRRGAKEGIVAVGRSILVIVWHLLSDLDARFHDLGPGLLRHPQQR